MAATKDMTTGNPTRLLFGFSLPLMLGNVLWMAAGMTQGFSILFAQHYGGKDDKSLHKSIGNAVILTIGAAVALTVTSALAGWCFSRSSMGSGYCL